MKKLPPIPKSVPSLLGPIPVTHVTDLKDKNGSPLLGEWEPVTRTIRLLTPIHLLTAWQTLFHEWTHAILFDTGFTATDEQTEHVCDAMALARTRELLDRSRFA